MQLKDLNFEFKFEINFLRLTYYKGNEILKKLRKKRGVSPLEGGAGFSGSI